MVNLIKTFSTYTQTFSCKSRIIVVAVTVVVAVIVVVAVAVAGVVVVDFVAAALSTISSMRTTAQPMHKQPPDSGLRLLPRPPACQCICLAALTTNANCQHIFLPVRFLFSCCILFGAALKVQSRREKERDRGREGAGEETAQATAESAGLKS